MPNMRLIDADLLMQTIADAYDWLYQNKMEFNREERVFALFGASILRLKINELLEREHRDDIP